jgi:signal transduction histidine kinase
MEQIWKQFAAWATASEHKIFFWARIKLTSIYVIILALILFGFSTILYQNLDRSLVDASEDNFADVESHHHFVESTLSTVGNEILLIDIFILIAAAGVSYVLAGYTLRPIQKSVEAQKKFSENASHELRTPIAVMKNDAEVLLRNPHASRELINNTLRSNIEEMDRMTKMTEDLLMLARSQNRSAVSFDKINLTDISRNIIAKLQPIAERKGVTLEVSDSDPLFIGGNKTGIERVIMNLLQNAIDHTPKGGTVRLKTAVSGSKGFLTISDTGSGIDEKDVPHVFKRFYKANGGGGNGLGLSIVKELIDQHGGKINLDSIKGLGTTVTVSLPIVT